MVVVDKLSKEAHFIPIQNTYKAANIADIFLKQIFCLHGIPKVIVSDKDPKFMGIFWKYLFKGLNTTLNFSTSFHPQTNGQTKRVNQVLQDLLRMYVKEQLGKWEDYLHLVEFAYNNHYQASARYSPFEILYGRKWNNPISWSNHMDRLVLVPKLLKEMDLIVKQVQGNLKIAQDRQKIQADLKRTPKEFQVGEHVFIKVRPKKEFSEVG